MVRLYHPCPQEGIADRKTDHWGLAFLQHWRQKWPQASRPKGGRTVSQSSEVWQDGGHALEIFLTQDVESWLFAFRYFHLKNGLVFSKTGQTRQSSWDVRLQETALTTPGEDQTVGVRDAGFLAPVSLRAWNLGFSQGPSNWYRVQGFLFSPHHLLLNVPSAAPHVSFPKKGTHLDYLQTGPHDYPAVGNWPSYVLLWKHHM